MLEELKQAVELIGRGCENIQTGERVTVGKITIEAGIGIRVKHYRHGYHRVDDLDDFVKRYRVVDVGNPHEECDPRRG